MSFSFSVLVLVANAINYEIRFYGNLWEIVLTNRRIFIITSGTWQLDDYQKERDRESERERVQRAGEAADWHKGCRT